jgi:exonuclease III
LKIQKDGYKGYEDDGSCALAEVWAAYMEALGCGIFAVQECRIPGQTETTCGAYRAYYSGRTTDAKRYHGVGIFILKTWMAGTVDVQPISDRLMWIHGTFHGTKRTIMVVYTPTESADEDTKDDLYLLISTELIKIRHKYGDNIIIMGDFNARVGTNTGFEYTDEEILGPFGIADETRTNVNGALLREFCKTHSFKVADTFFESANGEYGTWRHSSGPEFNAALDHALVHTSIWHQVQHCGTRYTDYALPPTDHRVVYLDVTGPPMGNRLAGTRVQKPLRVPPTADQKLQRERERMNKRILEGHRNKDADKENEQLGTLIAIEIGRLMDELAYKMPATQDPREELDRLLAILTESLDNARMQLWPQGVPFTKTPRPGTWFEGEPMTKVLITNKHKAYMRLRDLRKNADATPEDIRKAEAASKAADKRVVRQLRRTREGHFIKLANRIQTAHDAKDYRLYYKLANLVNLPERKEISRGPQLPDENLVRKKGKSFTRNAEETEARWTEFWMELYNQPGEVGQKVNVLLPKQQPLNQSILDIPFTEAELVDGLRKMANDKTAGPDGYAVEVDRCLNCPEHRKVLLNLFNHVLDTGIMPAEWKDVIIVAVYKRKGPTDDCNNYRGISLLSHNSKLLERMILHRLEPSLEEYVPINQYGFKKKCGTVDAILISKLLATSAYNQRLPDIRCYVDLTKAYDKVNRELLWQILRRLGIPEKVIRLITSFHEGARAQARVNGNLSRPFPLNRGLKQGSVLSPILFNIFFGALIRAFEAECAKVESTSKIVHGAHIKYNLADGFMSPAILKDPTSRSISTQILYDILYADDCVIFCNSQEGMQSMMDTFDLISKEFGMEIALKKTQILCNKFLQKKLEINRALPSAPANIITKDGPAFRLRKRVTPRKPVAQADTRPIIAIDGVVLEVVQQFK